MKYFVQESGPGQYDVCYNRPGRKETIVVTPCTSSEQAEARIAELNREERARSLNVAIDQRNRGFR